MTLLKKIKINSSRLRIEKSDIFAPKLLKVIPVSVKKMILAIALTILSIGNGSRFADEVLQQIWDRPEPCFIQSESKTENLSFSFNWEIFDRTINKVENTVICCPVSADLGVRFDNLFTTQEMINSKKKQSLVSHNTIFLSEIFNKNSLVNFLRC